MDRLQSFPGEARTISVPKIFSQYLIAGFYQIKKSYKCMSGFTESYSLNKCSYDKRHAKRDSCVDKLVINLRFSVLKEIVPVVAN